MADDEKMTPAICRARAKECRDMGRKDRDPNKRKQFVTSPPHGSNFARS